MRKLLIAGVILLGAGCVTTTTTSTLIDPMTGEEVTIVEERRDLTETGKIAAKVAAAAARDYVEARSAAEKQEAELKASRINDFFGFQRAQLERANARADRAWEDFEEAGGIQWATDEAIDILARIKHGATSATPALPPEVVGQDGRLK